MMRERKVFDLVAALRDTPVEGITWGELMTPAQRASALIMKSLVQGRDTKKFLNGKVDMRCNCCSGKPEKRAY